MAYRLFSWSTVSIIVCCREGEETDSKVGMLRSSCTDSGRVARSYDGTDRTAGLRYDVVAVCCVIKTDSEASLLELTRNDVGQHTTSC